MKVKIPKSIPDDAYKVISDLATHYTLAYCLHTLETVYGFRKGRLDKFMVELCKILNDDIPADDLLKYMEEKYDIKF